MEGILFVKIFYLCPDVHEFIIVISPKSSISLQEIWNSVPDFLNASALQHGEVNMENSEVEVDDAVATIIGNVEFREFAPEVVGENFVVGRIQESVAEGEQAQQENQSYSEETFPCDIQYDTEALEQPTDVRAPKQKKQCMPRKRRTEEDGNYPNIKSWKPYINTLIDEGVRGYHKTPIPVYNGTFPKVDEYLKPDIILWDLQKEFPEINGNLCPAENCNEPLALYPIAYTYMMRVLYDFERPVLLVTSMLRCKNAREHRFLGYDPRILKQLSDQESVPFVLFHKVGMTRELFNSIMNQVSNGVKFGQIQDMLRKNYVENHVDREKAYLAAVEQYNRDHPDPQKKPEVFPTIKIKGPRNTFIGQCFLLGFKEKEYFYKLSMSQLLADEWVILDELKLPTNVGTNAKGVWKKEVDHLFYCQNEVGQVLTWQLTGRCSITEIKEMLISVKDRHEQIGKQMKGCCTGFCCEWRDNLIAIFGPEFQVKCDVERAIAKLSEKLQEESLMYLPCTEDFRLVFQDPVDSNKVRILPTPSPGIILNSLEVFKEKWKKIKEENGKLVLTNAAIRVIEELESHIISGCYSNIPPFPNGIDRKDFQFSLRKKVNNCRLGIPVMVAIASIALHDHNTSRQEDLGRDTAPVLLVVPDEEKAVAEDLSGTVSLGNSNLQCLTVEVNMNKALESIASSQAKAIKCSEEVDCKALLQSVNEYFDNSNKDSKDHDYQINDQCLDDTIIKRTITFLRYAKTLSKFVSGVHVTEKLIPFLTCAFPLLLQDKETKEKNIKMEIISKELLKFTDLEVVWDSVALDYMPLEETFLNSISKVVSIYMSYKIDDKDDEDDIRLFQKSLKELGFELGINTTDVSKNLKKLLKIEHKDTAADSSEREGLKSVSKADDSNDCKEEPKADNDETENKKLKDDNKSISDIGEFEAIVREVANILSVQISVISCMKSFPVIPVFPHTLSAWSPNIFLFYIGGSFVPVVPKDVLSDASMPDKGLSDSAGKERKQLANVKCRCGRGNSGHSEGKCYTHENSKYITRCMCFRLQQPCTNKCDCKNCKNPYGDRPLKHASSLVKASDTESPASSEPVAKRRRHTHHHSNLSKDLRAENFQTGAGIEVSLGKWSLAEKLLFESLISEMKTEEDSLTTELVAQKFNNVVQVASNIAGLKNLVGFKTPTQVNERLKDREKDVEEYLVMYQTQLDLLLSKEGSMIQNEGQQLETVEEQGFA